MWMDEEVCLGDAVRAEERGGRRTRRRGEEQKKGKREKKGKKEKKE
jgi:hypothetical protein